MRTIWSILNNSLLKIHNVSQENMKPELKQEQKHIVDNFDRLRRTILKHKDSNRNLGLKETNPNECAEPEIHSKMYSIASLEFRKELSDSASKILRSRVENEVSAIISMPLTERGRNNDKPQNRSSKERRSSHRKKSKEMCHCKRHPQK